MLKQKSDMSTVIPIFHSIIQNQFGAQKKGFRSDNARDYFNQTMLLIFSPKGLIHAISCVYTPQQNRGAERKNRHLFNTTQALLFQGKVPKSYCGESVLTAAYLINRLPSHILENKSPLETVKFISLI